MKRILLIRMSSLGDVIHTFPALTDLRRALPDADLEWVVEQAYLPLVRMHPGVTRVLPIALRRWRRQLASPGAWREAGAFRRSLREHAYDAILDTQGLLKSAMVAGLARGPVYGFGRGTAHERFATCFYDVMYDFTPADHKIERYRAVAARALGYVPGPLDYGIVSPPRPAGAPLSRYCVLLTSTARDAKLWRDAAWSELGRSLAPRGLTCVLPWGDESERLRAERIAAGIPGSVVPKTRLSLVDVCGLIGHAQLVIGLDTGFTHVAAALRIPVLGIFCDSEPLDVRPLGTGRTAFCGGVGEPPSVQQAIAALAELD